MGTAGVPVTKLSTEYLLCLQRASRVFTTSISFVYNEHLINTRSTALYVERDTRAFSSACTVRRNNGLSAVYALYVERDTRMAKIIIMVRRRMYRT